MAGIFCEVKAAHAGFSIANRSQISPLCRAFVRAARAMALSLRKVQPSARRGTTGGKACLQAGKTADRALPAHATRSRGFDARMHIVSGQVMK